MTVKEMLRRLLKEEGTKIPKECHPCRDCPDRHLAEPDTTSWEEDRYYGTRTGHYEPPKKRTAE